MKKALFLLALLFFATMSAFTQIAHIDSIRILPAIPKSTDTLTIYASCSFGYSGCRLSSSLVNQQTLTATATHCIGFLSAICNRVDTFTISPRSPGTYRFKLSLFTSSSSDCSNPILSVSDSLSFSVIGLPTSIGYESDFFGQCRAYYSKGQFHIESLPSGIESYQLRITSLTGQTVFYNSNCLKNVSLPMDLSSGVYVATIAQGSHRMAIRIVVD